MTDTGLTLSARLRWMEEGCSDKPGPGYMNEHARATLLEAADAADRLARIETQVAWQPIETAPNSRLLLLWLEGWEAHSGVTWRREGMALGALHDGIMSAWHLSLASERIIGPSESRPPNDWFLAPTHWMRPGVPIIDAETDTGERT